MPDHSFLEIFLGKKVLNDVSYVDANTNLDMIFDTGTVMSHRHTPLIFRRGLLSATQLIIHTVAQRNGGL